MSDDPKAGKEREDPPEVVLERMTNALKRALKTPPKPHEGLKVSPRSAKTRTRKNAPSKP